MSDMWWFVVVALIGWLLGNCSRYSLAKYSVEQMLDDAQRHAEKMAMELVDSARKGADIESQRRLRTAILREADLRKLQVQLGNMQYNLRQWDQELKKREKLVKSREKDIEKSEGKIRRAKDRLKKAGSSKTENT